MRAMTGGNGGFVNLPAGWAAARVTAKATEAARPHGMCRILRRHLLRRLVEPGRLLPYLAASTWN